MVVAHAPLLLFERPACASQDQVPVNTNKSVQVPYSTLVLSWRLLNGTGETCLKTVLVCTVTAVRVLKYSSLGTGLTVLCMRLTAWLAVRQLRSQKYNVFQLVQSWVPYGSTRTGNFRAVSVGETSGCGACTVASV